MKFRQLTALVLSLSFYLTSMHTHATQIFEQQGTPPLLIELYTSEGCSSCPPADNHLAKLVNSPDLWKKYVPVAFHVDYWDYIGWPDRFAQPEFKARQYNYRRLGKSRSVYTPGWFVDGQEWRGFFQRRDYPQQQKIDGGKLTAELNNNQLIVTYQPTRAHQTLIAHLAVLGFDLSSKVTAGENHGRLLEHQFVVLDKQQKAQLDYQWEFALPELTSASRKALVVWVSPRDQTPLQVTGNWLDTEE